MPNADARKWAKTSGGRTCWVERHVPRSRGAAYLCMGSQLRLMGSLVKTGGVSIAVLLDKFVSLVLPVLLPPVLLEHANDLFMQAGKAVPE